MLERLDKLTSNCARTGFVNGSEAHKEIFKEFDLMAAGRGDLTDDGCLLFRDLIILSLNWFDFKVLLCDYTIFCEYG